MIKKKGFTLVELLAVIVILAIILVIAVPQIMDTIDSARKASLESSAKMVAAQVENQHAVSQTLGTNFSSSGDCTTAKWAGLNDKDYESCTYSIDSNGKASVTLVGKGKFEGKYVCDGTRTLATATEESCTPTIPVLNCTFDGVLEVGAEFTHNQYTYRYKQEYTWDDDWNTNWQNIDGDGWGVILTDKNSTDPVNTPICTYINGKPLLSTTLMFYTYENDPYTEIFSQAESINVSTWNTSTVTNMYGMFLATPFEEIKGLTNLDTSNVINMSSMFDGSEATSLDLSSFNTSNVTDMYSMFTYSAATSLDLSSFNTSNVTDMGQMFLHSAATSLNLSSFNTSNVTDMYGMFWDSAATSLDLRSFDTSNVTEMSYMFKNSKATSLDLSSFNTSNVTNMYGMFWDSAATSLDLRSFDTSNVTNMSFMFSSRATTSLNLSSFDTSNVTDMSNMFDVSAATSLDLSSFNTSNVTNMSSMFSNSAAISLNLSSFDTSNVTNMSHMFAVSAATSLDLSSFDTSNVTNMYSMFYLSKATEGIARTQADADKFNATNYKPSTLTFIVKPTEE